jgi:pre-rRNA-processing protein TSR3
MTLPTIIIRHPRENLKKCSLRGLEDRPDFLFFKPRSILPDLSSYIYLQVGAKPLSQEDAQFGLLLLDATWRLAKSMETQLFEQTQMQGITLHARSLPPHHRTAYPRRQTDCPDPHAGLASIEALYLAYQILGRSTDGLLDHYHWKNDFLKRCANDLHKIY